MSRAFVREGDGETAPLPERAISAQPNLVTARGLALLDAELLRLGAARQAARTAGEREQLAAIERDLRYFTARRESARLVAPTGDAIRLRFGMQAQLRMPDGSERSFRFVGEDEAKPAAGLISHAAPLARALLGREPGQRVPFGAGEVEILALLA
jgi:transcription elongation GreA/GreB family factor